MNTLCIHHNDADGRASAAIVRRALGSEVTLYEMAYGDPTPLEHIITADHIIIADFCLPAEEMLQLATYHKLTWIDHHKSAIDELGELSQNWAGIRDVDEAASVLTWRYFFPEEPIPKAITLIGDRDVWRWAEEDTGPFNEGLYQVDNRPFIDLLWTALLDDDTNTIQRIIEQGKLIRDARIKRMKSEIPKFGFEVLFEGYRTLVLNERGSGDVGAFIRSLDYELAYCYIDKMKDGTLCTFVALYADGVDVSKIAQKYGGGGHAGAAGFNFRREDSPFPKDAHVEYLFESQDKENDNQQ